MSWSASSASNEGQIPAFAGLRCVRTSGAGKSRGMSFVLWIIAVILAIVGVVQILQGQIIFGIVLLVAACLVGPGGYSIFQRRGAR